LKQMHYFIMISRVIIGTVFVFSGFVKAIDPLGSAYKFGDYFTAFGIHFLNPIALPLAVFLSSAELTMGFAFLISYRMKFFSWAVLVFMSFFTALTFILAIYNPVSDCGCFGDALILTNWETFGKNIVILLFVLLVFYYRKHFITLRGTLNEWIVILLFFLATSWLSVYSHNHLPLLDFRPYNIGANLPHKMTIPPDAPKDVYETTLVYNNNKTGKNEEFSMENFPRDTVMYSFVDAQSKLISKGYEPPVHDFSITSLNGTDISDFILKDNGYSFLLISHNLTRANKDGMKKAEALARFARIMNNMEFYGITASTNEVINDFKSEEKPSFEFYHADEITLKTIVRSNPGLVLLKNGTIIGKWHYNDFPTPGINKQDFSDVIENYPFAPGTNLRDLITPPPGASSDRYETILYYKNILTDSISEFTIDDFPKSDEWVFVNSRTEMVKQGFISPLSDFKPLTPEGNELYADIINSKDNVFIALAGDPESIDPELLVRVNNLSVMASGNEKERFSFFLITQLTHDRLVEFGESFISPIQLARMEGSFSDQIAGDGIALIWIKDGTIMSIKKNKDIPIPTDLDNFLSVPEKFLTPIIISCLT
jgi:uncharacterized membrane protein YphA (DoxX/SURF4 family)